MRDAYKTKSNIMVLYTSLFTFLDKRQEANIFWI
jgi:hypothetical protein